MWVFKFHKPPSLFHVSENRNSEGEIAESYFPVLSVQRAPLFSGKLQVAEEVFPVGLVDRHEVPRESDECGASPDGKNVFDPVAILAERPEAHEPLPARSLVVVPNLVAVEPSVPAANLTPVSGALVDL
jgi:hypothetical protein